MDLDGLTVADRRRLLRRLSRARRSGNGADPRELEEIEAAIEAARARRRARASAVPEIRYPEDLPVSAHRAEVLSALRDHQVVVVAGETGSGKTTQIPKMCLELGRGVDGIIGHTQPRRIAARSVAERLAEELGVPLGGAVGYAVRFDDAVGEGTLVKVMTDGILLAEIRRDRLLSAYDTIIVDEAHERSLNIDFLLGYLAGLLPKRPDLQVVITSATIDTARFAGRFSAPVVEVSGRAHPVEIRYRPPGEEEDLLEALCGAVREVLADAPGDVLVFLAGERDIRDAGEALSAALPDDVEILPLYARLSAAEQHRVFRPHGGRRVVLATNVAETSLTVPAIRAVVDTGLARISRYSHRTKVQRLPIEPISQASADQRAGRCGRLGPGICVRLYSQEDYSSRPRFPEPEILRTNLASVVLQMAVIGLGDLERFPFLDPPDRRSVADAKALLEELGALELRAGRARPTAVGRRLADLPLDPRLGRAVIEAERLGCLRETTIVAAALSVQDPRERPRDRQEEADGLHRRFAVPESDFLGYLRLFDYLGGLESQLSRNQFRRRCRAEHLNVLRIREWQDVVGQIRQGLRASGLHAAQAPATSEAVHRALLAGLLSHVGMLDRSRGDYRGARGTRWRISRQSALARRSPEWAVAASLVETGGTWARTVARIEPGWVEEAGAHLLKRRYSEPWWDSQRGETMTEEHATLYGLPVVAGRPVRLAALDPSAARREFIERALVGGDWQGAIPVLERTLARIDRVRALEARARRHLLAPDAEALTAFFDERLPKEVTGGRDFERWWRRVGPGRPDLLDVPYRLLLAPGARSLDLSCFPETWHSGGIDLPLRYRWEPGTRDDGVTALIPIAALNRVPDEGFDWLVPGARAELVETLVRQLPKPLRRVLGPASEVARRVLTSSGPADGPLPATLAAILSRLAGERVGPERFDLTALPPHLRMGFEVLGEEGEPLRWGRDLGLLRKELRAEIRRRIARAAPELERHGLTGWSIGDLPKVVERDGLLAYPSLVDEGGSVGVALLESAEAQQESMRLATRRLLRLKVPVRSHRVLALAGPAARREMRRPGRASAELLEDCTVAALDEIVADRGGPAYDEAGFDELVAAAGDLLERRVAELAGLAAEALDCARRVAQQADRLERGDPAGVLADALADVRGQVRALVRPGFVARHGPARAAQLPRYLEAALLRLARLPADLRRDGERAETIRRVQASYERVAAAGSWSSSGAELAGIRWMIEELRVSLWAQRLGTAVPVSEERILRALERLSALDTPRSPPGPPTRAAAGRSRP